jgi:hypothetical protein
MLWAVLVLVAFNIHIWAIHFRFTSLRFMRSAGDSGGQVNNTPESAALLWELGNKGHGICLCKVMERCLLKEATTWYVIHDPAPLSLFSLSVCIPCYLTIHRAVLNQAVSLLLTAIRKLILWIRRSANFRRFQTKFDMPGNFNCRSQWPRVLQPVACWDCRFQSRPGPWKSVPCEICVLSGRGLCDGLITRPEESYRVWCICVWFRNLVNEEALAHWGLLNCKRKIMVINWFFNEKFPLRTV